MDFPTEDVLRFGFRTAVVTPKPPLSDIAFGSKGGSALDTIIQDRYTAHLRGSRTRPNTERPA